MDKSLVDILWVSFSVILVFIMQPGFLCVESGFTRTKNSINVAIKNLADFGLTALLFWISGYALMFGTSHYGLWGITAFMPELLGKTLWEPVFFIFQLMFCGTAVTILSGAIAERVKFSGYLLLTLWVAGIIYPVFGHWVWNGLEGSSETSGWLAQYGFYDFAGSSVVHSVGGWAGLAIILIIGPRIGRFSGANKDKRMISNNIPLATLGVFLLWVSWFGFNAGSNFAFNIHTLLIIIKTLIAGASGLLSALCLGWLMYKRADVSLMLNGTLCGLVSITASVYAVSLLSSVSIGLIAGIVFLLIDKLLIRFEIDDAVGAIPVHLGGGIWGTLAVAFFADPAMLGTGLTWSKQLSIQLVGIATCALWAFLFTYLVFKLINYFYPLRVLPENELLGLNISEHDARTDLLEILKTLDDHANHKNLSSRITLDKMSEFDVLAEKYNKVADNIEKHVLYEAFLYDTYIKDKDNNKPIQ